MANTITIPVENTQALAEVVAGLQKECLAFRVETTCKDFIITVTGY